VAAIADCTDEAALKAVLCRLRNREMVRIAWRNLAGWVDLEDTVTTLSALAGACLDAAAWVYGTVVHEARRAPGLAVSVSRVPDQYRGHGRRAAEGRVSGRRRHGRDGRMVCPSRFTAVTKSPAGNSGTFLCFGYFTQLLRAWLYRPRR